jgi:hypothetical protein
VRNCALGVQPVEALVKAPVARRKMWGGGSGLLVLGVCRASNEVQSPLLVFHSFRKLLWMLLADNDN